MLLSTEKFPGPGPAIRQDRRFTRFGKIGTPVYTMRPFYPPLEADCVPGPPTYEWEKVHPCMEPHAPNYTMRRRTRYMLLPNNPAPNQYHLRTVIGRGQGCFPWEPGWTILEDNKYYTFQKDLAKTPGPASVRVHPKVMDRVGHYVRAPCYTIGRRTGPVEKSRAPGPNVYGPEFVTLHKPGIPELSFGERHSEFAGAMISRIDSKCLNLSQLLSRLPKPIWSGMRRSTACVTVVTAWTAIKQVTVATVWKYIECVTIVTAGKFLRATTLKAWTVYPVCDNCDSVCGNDFGGSSEFFLRCCYYM